MLRFVKRGAGAAGVVGVAGLAVCSYAERPFAEVDDGLWYNARGQKIPVEGPESEGRVVDKPGSLKANKWTKMGVSAARSVVMPVVATMGHLVLRCQNTLDIAENDAYANFAKLVEEREDGVGLLTVSNHTSVLDDPFLMAAIVPLPAALDARKLRWGGCSQEVCFSRGAFVSAFFGAGTQLYRFFKIT